MLTLDPTTLFFWDLSDVSKKIKYNSSTVSQWASAIPKDAKADSCLSSKHSASTGHSAAPSLTNRSTITTTSVQTSELQRRQLPPRIHVKREPEEDADMDGGIKVLSNEDGQLYTYEEGAISDRDEMNGEEHDDAVKSPPKGSGVRLGSEVRL